MPGKVDLHFLRLSPERLHAMTPRERYVFLLLGHVFNGIMVLQKLSLATRPSPGAERFQQTGGTGYVMVLLPLLAGKVYEALLLLRRHSIDRDLRRDYLDPLNLGPQWDALLASADALTWLPDVRNQHAFHYMSPGQWLRGIGEVSYEDASVIVGRRYGDTFFHISDALASLHLMRLVNAEEPFAGLATMLEEVGNLAGQLLDLIARGLQTRMVDHLTEGAALEDAVTLEAPTMDELHLPYFWANENLQLPES